MDMGGFSQVLEAFQYDSSLKPFWSPLFSLASTILLHEWEEKNAAIGCLTACCWFNENNLYLVVILLLDLTRIYFIDVTQYFRVAKGLTCSYN